MIAQKNSASDENAVRLRFRRNRLLANSLLAGMGVVFAATHLVDEPNLAVQLAQAASEAGLVGGIADWFAVTALFRHPLGLPIPHTAIVPKSKDRIADSLGGFIEQHFLTREIVSAKLRDLHAGRRLAAWLTRPRSAPLITDAVIKALPYIIRSLGTPELRGFADRLLGDQIRNADITPVVVRILRALSTSNELDTLFDHGVDFAARALAENRQEIEAAVRQRSQWWVPGLIDKKIATAIVNALSDVVAKLHEPDSQGRQRFKSWIFEFITALETSPERQASINAAKNRLLEHPDVKAWIASIWSDLSDAAITDLEKPSSHIGSAIEKGIGIFGRMLAEDASAQGHIDRTLERMALYAVSWRRGIGSFFTDVVRNWDARTLTARIEEVVGSDLQYIRMNGTVVGALVGCALFAITHLFS